MAEVGEWHRTWIAAAEAARETDDSTGSGLNQGSR